ncbi:MAG: SGNH/GDSL hydrolase family protein [Polyangiales bacterium]|nr:SGNH/GDSL hydrolase family protein [Myxococcales bacterium]MCB9659110.1 SGNH/GDSL hydrolase family protein [Sandaracinaceae bacterium]
MTAPDQPRPAHRTGALFAAWLALLGTATGCVDDRDTTFRYDQGGDGGGDLGSGDAGVDLGMDSATYPTSYPDDRTLSPITPHVAAHLREVVARGGSAEDVFIKVGASATYSNAFLHCFAGSNVDLDGRSGLQPTLDHFLGGDIDGSSPFGRTSQATEVGRGAAWAIAGDPSPLDTEVMAANPRYAVVMYGTNDIEQTNVFNYANSVLDLTDQLLDEGIIPMWSSIMPRDDNPTSDLEVPAFNMAVRAVAQARQVPFIDLHRELLPLPAHGLGPDDLHPAAFGGGACVLTEEGLQFGYNVRNLLTLQTLDRALRVVDGGAAPDPAGPRLVGDGSPDAPFVIPGLPFSHVANTLFGAHDNIDTYPGCSATQDESGPELLYRLDLATPTTIRVLVFDRGMVDIDVHVLSGLTGADCVARHHQDLSLSLDAGTHYLSLDTFVDAAGEHLGEYIVAVLEAP